ncbi:OmpA family protein [soil metagenome]
MVHLSSKTFLIIFLAMPLLLCTCVSSKRYHAVVDDNAGSRKKAFDCDQRNANLLEENGRLRNDSTRFSNDNFQLASDLGSLRLSYDSLMNSSLSQAGQLSAALRFKTEELRQKEILLALRESRLNELETFISRQDSVMNALNNVVKNALNGFKSDELTVEQRNGKIYISMSDKLLFKSGSAAVEDKGKQALRKLADVMIKNPEIGIQVEGHTDSLPINTTRYKDNWDLSVDRAVNITRILSNEYHVNPKSITASGRAEFQPKSSNATTDGRAQNRRTEIILVPKLDMLFNFMQTNKPNQNK